MLNSGSKRRWLPEEGVIRFVLKVQNKLNLLPWIKEGVRNILADPRRAVFSRILRLYLDSMGSLLILYQVCPGRKRGNKDARGSHSGIKGGCLCHRVLSSVWISTPEEVGPMGKGHSSDEKEKEGGSELELNPQFREPCPMW